MDTNMETEAKYHLRSALGDGALATLRLSPYTLRLKEDEQQQDLLLDTPNHLFYHTGYALRLRRTHGQLVLTLKRPGQVNDGVHIREELEANVADANAFTPRRWPPQIATPVLALIGDQPVMAQVELHIHRQTWRVERANRLVAELVVDRGMALAGDASADIQELEVELKGDGAPRDLAKLDQRLRKRLSLTPEATSKFARGMALVEAAEPSQSGFTPLATMVARLIADETRKLRKQGQWLQRHNQPRRIRNPHPKDSEHTHKLRVTTRRLRLATQLAGQIPSFPQRRLKRLNQGLRRLGQALGALRDGEIVQERVETLLASLASLATAHGGETTDKTGDAAPRQETSRGANRLGKAVMSQRISAHQKLLTLLDQGVVEALDDDLRRLTKRLNRLERANAAPGETTSTPVTLLRQLAGSMLWQTYENVERVGAVAMRAEAAPEDRHRLRRACKWLRYTIEAFQEALGAQEVNEPLLTAVLDAQNHLGKLQDDTLTLRALLNGKTRTSEKGGKRRASAVGVAADAVRAELTQGVAAFWPLWERLSGAPYRAHLAEAIARL